MGSTTPRAQLYKAAAVGEQVNVTTQINAAFDKIDGLLGATPVTSGTRPSTPFDGQIIRETDTGRVLVSRNSEWVDFFIVRNSSPATIVPRSTAQTWQYVTDYSGAVVQKIADRIFVERTRLQPTSAYTMTAGVMYPMTDAFATDLRPLTKDVLLASFAHAGSGTPLAGEVILDTTGVLNWRPAVDMTVSSAAAHFIHIPEFNFIP